LLFQENQAASGRSQSWVSIVEQVPDEKLGTIFSHMEGEQAHGAKQKRRDENGFISPQTTSALP
jgi:hypothetical protein